MASAGATDLPEPVRRYLRFAVPPGAAPIRTAQLRHNGYFRPNPGPRWFPIQGEQSFTLDPPGFVWHARLRMLPLVWIEARDSLISGRGGMLIKLNSIFTMADARGPETDQGARARWLAEAVWFPVAFASNHITWEAIDEHSARATLAGDGLPVSLVMRFDAEGRAVQVCGERYRGVEGGRSVLTSWSGNCTDYQDFGGIQAPSRVEACWNLDSGPFAYARFHLTELKYN